MAKKAVSDLWLERRLEGCWFGSGCCHLLPDETSRMWAGEADASCLYLDRSNHLFIGSHTSKCLQVTRDTKQNSKGAASRDPSKKAITEAPRHSRIWGDVH